MSLKVLDLALKILGISCYDLTGNSPKRDIFWSLYGVALHMAIAFCTIGQHVDDTDDGNEIDKDDERNPLGELFGTFGDGCDLLGMFLLLMNSRGLAQLHIFFRQSSSDIFFRYKVVVKMQVVDKFSFCLIVGTFSLTSFFWKDFLGGNTSIECVVPSFLLFMCVSGILVSVLYFRASCFNILKLIRAHSRELIRSLLNADASQEKSELFSSLREKTENYELFLFQATKAKERYLASFFWCISLRIIGNMFCIVTLVYFALMTASFLMIFSAAMFSGLVLIVYETGDSFTRQVIQIADEVNQAAACASDVLLQIQMMRVKQQLSKVSYVTMGGAYSLNRSSFITILNSLLGFVIILLQMRDFLPAGHM